MTEEWNRPSVAAVIVTFNRVTTLRSTLKALAAQTRAVDDVVVVDNASTDETGAVLAREFPAVRHIRLRMLGAWHGLRRGRMTE